MKSKEFISRALIELFAGTGCVGAVYDPSHRQIVLAISESVKRADPQRCAWRTSARHRPSLSGLLINALAGRLGRCPRSPHQECPALAEGGPAPLRDASATRTCLFCILGGSRLPRDGRSGGSARRLVRASSGPRPWQAMPPPGRQPAAARLLPISTRARWRREPCRQCPRCAGR
jgi:hypothetical protein